MKNKAGISVLALFRDETPDVNLRVVLQKREHDLGQGFVVLDTSGGGSVLFRVLVCRVGGHFRGDVFPDTAGHSVGVAEERAKVFVERLQNVAQAVEFRLGFAPAAFDRHRTNLRVVIGEGDLQHGLFLDAVAVHVDGFQDVSRQVFIRGRGQFRNQQVQEDGELFPLAIGVRYDRG